MPLLVSMENLIMTQWSVSSYDDLTKDCEQIDMLCEKSTWRSRDTRTQRETDRERQRDREIPVHS
jgi:hypothetical protein